MELNIYTSSGILKTTCDPADSDTGVKEIMADNVINLSFILFENIKLEVNDYVDFYGERYYCLEEYFPTQKNTVEWEYRCQFFGIEGLTRRALCLNNADGGMEADFSLTDTPENHLRLIVGNINRVLNTTIWKMGECIIGENITLEYSGVYCSDALNNLAQKCETEWWFDGLKLNLSRCEIGNNIELAYGSGLLSLSRQAADNVKFFTRLFPVGSKRNIVPDQYGASRLQLPEGIKYLEQNTQYGIIEHFESAAFEKIYPRRVGTISSVRIETKTGADGKPFAIYYFADKDLNFDPNSYEIAGLVKNIYFDSGELNGRDFEVNFNSTTKEFEIINQYPDENTQLPGGGLVPKVGNKYILYNITMPAEYYALAETEYKEAVLAYMAKNNKDKAVYKAPTDYIELDERNIRLLLGQRVKLISEKYFPQTGYKLSRITRISRKLNNPNEAEIEISDVLGTGKITLITNEITKTTEVVKGVDKRQEVSAKRQNKALTELENYLLDTEGYYDVTKFKALSIEARMLAVGLQSQNFTLSGIRVTPNSGNLTTVVVTSGTLTHASLEVAGLGSTWAIAGKTLSAPDVNKAYYIYAKCSKNTLQGTIEISETELKVEHFPNYYVFNLGVLYPQRSGESWRDYSATYGVTSIVGDQIYGGGIKALDGFNFVDLRAIADGGRFRLGDRDSSMDFGVTEPKTLTLLNTKLVSKGGNSSYAPVYRGAWTNAELYYAGETVTYNGSMYQCKQDCPTAGIMPVNMTYWDKTVEKGVNGQDGQNGAPGAKGEKGEIGEMLSAGKMTDRDVEFREGMNGCYVYNNLANGNVVITRILKPADCPTTSTHCLEVKTIGEASPAHGGFVQYIVSRPNAVFIQKIIAKLPIGCYLQNRSNSMGDGAKDYFITPAEGTGKYETYLRKIVCGTTGTFSSGGYIALVGGAAPVTWYVAAATAYDMTESELYDKAIRLAAEAAETEAKAHADGIVTAEEQRAIADAAAKADAAKREAILAAAMDTTDKIDGIQIGGVNLMLNSKQIKLAGEWYNSSPLLFSQPLRPGKNYILSVSNMLDGLYFRIYPAGGGWETGVNVPFNTPFAVNSEFVHGLFYAGVNGTVQTAKLEEGNKVTAWSTAPEDIIIAGENLIINRQDIVTSGADFPAKTSYSSTIINGIRETTVTSLSSDNTMESYRYAFMQGLLAKNLVDLEPGEYVFSFDYKTNCNRGYMQIDIRDAENGNIQVFQSQLLAYTSTWKRGFFIADWRGKTAIHLAMLLLVMTDNSATGNYVAYRNLKLAKGNTGYSDSSSPEDVEAANKKHAEAQKELAEVTSKAYADNVVTAEEARAIADAQSKADAAKREAILTAALDTTDKINNLQLGGVNLLIGTSSAETDLNMPTSNYVFPLGGGILLSTLGLSPGELVTFAAIMSYLSSSISLYRIIVTCVVNGVTQYFYGAFVGIGNRAHCSITIPSGATTIAFYFSLVTAPTQAVAFKYKCIKLERGNKPTDWSPAPNDTITQAVESSAKNLGLTKIEGGLIWTNIVKLQRIGGQETAGISGIDKDSSNKYLPAFWAGGNYASAINNKSNVVIKHSGASKLGRMYLDEAGATTYKDNSGVDRLINTPENISTLNQLLGSSQPEIGGNIQSYDKNIIYSTFNEEKTLADIIVTKNNADLFIKNVTINAQLNTNSLPGNGIAQITLMLAGNGAKIWLGEAYVNVGKDSGSEDSQYDTKIVSTSLKVAEGTYSLLAQVYLHSSSDLIAASVSVYGGSISWQYIANIRRTEIGSNGMMTFADINNFFYAAVENGKLKVVLKSQEAADMPGVLAAGSVATNAGVTNGWGAKFIASAQLLAAGKIRVNHKIGHTNYTVQVTPATSDYAAKANVIAKYATYFVVITTDSTNNYQASYAFDYLCIGEN